jgi:putative tryptophan/tyrosine transport system substrate-binding protein
VRAQQPAVPVIGYLTFSNRTGEGAAGFSKALNQAGYIDGRNVRIEVHSADRQPARLPELAANLVRGRVAVIVALDGAAIDAARAATSTIPIVFNTNLDPVKFGLAASLSRPGGNLTGMTLMTSEIVGKQLQLLHEMVPKVTIFGYLSDPETRTAEDLTNNMVAASHALGTELIVAEARSRSDIDTAFATLVQRGIGALVVGPYLRFDTSSDRVLEFVARNKIPAMYRSPSWVRRGGLMSYGANIAGLNKATVNYVVQILNGAKPANLPVQQPTAFDLTINLTTAKGLGLTVPQTLFVVATELID